MTLSAPPPTYSLTLYTQHMCACARMRARMCVSRNSLRFLFQSGHFNLILPSSFLTASPFISKVLLCIHLPDITKLSLAQYHFLSEFLGFKILLSYVWNTSDFKLVSGTNISFPFLKGNFYTHYEISREQHFCHTLS